MSISKRIAILLIAVFFTSSFVISYLVYFYTSAFIKDQVEKNQEQLAQTILNDINNIIDERHLDIKDISGSSEFVNILKQPSASHKQAQDRLINHQLNTGPWDELNLITPEGKIILSSNEKRIGQQASGEEMKLVTKTLWTGTNISDAVISQSSQKPTVFFSSEIKSTINNQPVEVGIVMGQLSWGEIIKILSLNIEPSVINLYNSEGTLIGSSNQEFNNQILNKNDREELIALGIIKSLDFENNDIKSQLDKFLVSSATQRSSQNYSHNSWILTIKSPADTAFAPVNATSTRIVLLLILMFFITSIVVWWMINAFVIKGVQNISQTAKNIVAGHFNQRVKVQSKDELGQLAINFNNMTDSLLEARASIEQKVQSQTKEIVSKGQELKQQQDAILNVLEDVESEKQAAQAQRDKINTIVQSIGDGVLVVDHQQNITLFNQAAAAISGFEAKQVIGKPFFQALKFVNEDNNNISHEFITNALATGIPQKMKSHTILIHKNGAKVPVADSAAPLKNKDGQVVGCVVVFRDISRERELEEAKNEFLSVAAHQLRTPLGSVRWNIEMMLDGDMGPLNPKLKETTKDMYQSNQRMISLVNDLLNVSRIDQGRVKDEPKMTNIVEIIQNVIKELDHHCQDKHLAIKFDHQYNLPQLMLDPKRFYEAVTNLISNAIKYSFPNGRIDVLLRQVDNCFELKVIDYGMGIPAAAQKRVFSKFFRADNAVKSETEGSGLGLFVVKSYVEAWGGSVTFTSQENKGTTFIVKLPLKPKSHNLDKNLASRPHTINQ